MEKLDDAEDLVAVAAHKDAFPPTDDFNPRVCLADLGPTVSES